MAFNNQAGRAQRGPLSDYSGAVRRAIAHAAGCCDYAYSRPGRRRIPGIVTPALRRPLVSVAVVIDTSGSMGQSELDGYGRILYLTKDVWPNFISCVLAVHDDVIKNQRAEVQRLVDGIARSGKWLDQTMDHRMQASRFVSQHYYNQHPRLLEFVLSKPPDRVKYTDLVPDDIYPDKERAKLRGTSRQAAKGDNDPGGTVVQT